MLPVGRYFLPSGQEIFFGVPFVDKNGSWTVGWWHTFYTQVELDIEGIRYEPFVPPVPEVVPFVPKLRQHLPKGTLLRDTILNDSVKAINTMGVTVYGTT